jgi:hypothetical protein
MSTFIWCVYENARVCVCVCLHECMCGLASGVYIQMRMCVCVCVCIPQDPDTKLESNQNLQKKLIKHNLVDLWHRVLGTCVYVGSVYYISGWSECGVACVKEIYRLDYYTTLHCATLHYTTLYCTTLHYTTLYCTTLHYPADDTEHRARNRSTEFMTRMQYQYPQLAEDLAQYEEFDKSSTGEFVCVCISLCLSVYQFQRTHTHTHAHTHTGQNLIFQNANKSDFLIAKVEQYGVKDGRQPSFRR